MTYFVGVVSISHLPSTLVSIHCSLDFLSPSLSFPFGFPSPSPAKGPVEIRQVANLHRNNDDASSCLNVDTAQKWIVDVK